METRIHDTPTTRSSATYSGCGRYRYALTREWDSTGRRVLFIMLNPSKADEIANDPTVERCEKRARALGFGAFRVTNIFAWRDTDPFAMRKAPEPVGPENDSVLLDSVAWSDLIICAWGTHGSHRGRGPEVAQMLRATARPLYTLGLTKDGHPKHPLYIAYADQPREWSL